MKFEEKYINFVNLKDGRVEFNTKDVFVSYAQYSEITASFTADKIRVPSEERIGLEKAFRYGQPVSINTVTFWSLDILMRALSEDNKKLSISKVIDMLLRNSSINPGNLSEISGDFYDASDEIKNLTVGLRKFISLEGGREPELCELYIPSITYHDIRLIRLLFLDLVSPELLHINELKHISLFLKSAAFKDDKRFSVEQLNELFSDPDSFNGDYVNDFKKIRDNAKRNRDSLRDLQKATRGWTNPKLNISDYLQDAIHLSFCTDSQIEAIDRHAKSLMSVRKKFGTITYEKPERYSFE